MRWYQVTYSHPYTEGKDVAVQRLFFPQQYRSLLTSHVGNSRCVTTGFQRRTVWRAERRCLPVMIIDLNYTMAGSKGFFFNKIM